MTIVDQVARWAAEKPDAPAYTFVDYSADSNGVRETLTWGEVDIRARSVAAAIRVHAQPGDRVAILAPQGLDYVLGVLGACYARVIAVPLFPPDVPAHRDRLAQALADCAPTCVLTTTATRERVDELGRRGAAPAPSQATVHRILVRNGRIDPQAQQHKRV